MSPASLPADHRYIIEADGGSRGNPGIAASGSIVIAATSGAVLARLGRYLGVATNNVAEYHGLLTGLRWVLEHDPDAELLVKLDSKLVVEQMSGRWKIKHPDMQQLATEARDLLIGVPVRFQWVARAENARADAAANRSMDLRADFAELAPLD